MGLISLLELDLVGTLNESGPITPEQARIKANRLLSLVIDSECRERIQQTWDGMAWIERSRALTYQGKCLKYVSEVNVNSRNTAGDSGADLCNYD